MRLVMSFYQGIYFSTMQPSLPMSLDVLISLCHDSYQEVSDYCDAALKAQFSNPERETMDSLCENFFATINCLPRIMNNIGEEPKYQIKLLFYISINHKEDMFTNTIKAFHTCNKTPRVVRREPQAVRPEPDSRLPHHPV